MGNGKGNNKAVPIGTIDRFQKPGWREDYVLRVLAPSKRNPQPRVELRVWVDNQTSNPPFQGLSTRGGYFAMTMDQFNALCNMKKKIAEAVKALTPEEGSTPAADSVPGAPDLDLLAGVVGTR